MTADRLFDLQPVHQLTDRQQAALTAIQNAGYDGLHTDELGAAVHAWQGKHPADTPCAFCGASGMELGRRLRQLGHAQQRRRKAPGGDTVTVWTVAGRLVKPRADLEADYDPFPKGF